MGFHTKLLGQTVIYIVGYSFAFPPKGAAIARAISYAKGLVAAGEKVKIICLKAQARTAGKDLWREDPWRGEYESIPFEYAPHTSLRPESFHHRRYLELKGAVRLWSLLAHSDPPPKAVILFSGPTLWSPLIIVCCKRLAIPCVREVNEYPFVHQRSTLVGRLYADAYSRLVDRLPDGFIAISTLLERYCEEIKRPPARVIRIPVLVDPEEFAAATANDARRPKIVYVGNLDHPGEVEDVIDSFSSVASDYSDWSLQIIGESLFGRELVLRRRVDDRGLAGRVVFTGALTREAMIREMSSAGLLALPRQDALFSRAGFATKLGEYLATGRPVVASAVGDVDLYLRDGRDAFLASGGVGFVDKLREALADPVRATEIGLAGRELAARRFSISEHGKRLAAFLNSLGSRSAPTRSDDGGRGDLRGPTDFDEH